MFKNAGKRLMGLAKFIFWLIVILGLILGFIFSLAKSEEIFILVGIIAGVLFGWISSLLLYAFGELCEEVRLLAELEENDSDSKPATAVTNVVNGNG